MVVLLFLNIGGFDETFKNPQHLRGEVCKNLSVKDLGVNRRSAEMADYNYFCGYIRK